MTQWFVEERCFSGEYRPAVYVGGMPEQKPSERKANKWRNEPVEVPEVLHSEGVRLIQSFMAPDGEFAEVPTDEIETILGQIS